MSQIELAEKIGLSFQQIQKYEKGVTRMSVLRLLQISEALGVHISTFFKEDNRILKVSSPTAEYGQEENPDQPFHFLDKEEAILLKLFRRIRNKKVKEGILKQLQGILELEKG